MLRTMPDTMSDKGRHALGGNADATWTAFNCGLCTGGICIPYATWPYATLNTTDATQLNSIQSRLTNAATETERYELVPGFQGCQRELWMTIFSTCGSSLGWGSSLARRVDFSRQTARFRFWNTPLSTLLGVCNADATGDATNATGTQRLRKPIGGATTSAV
jgi:hypothetical protein